MQPYEVAPPAALQARVKCLWHSSLDFSGHPAGFEVMPDGYAEIIFYFGGPCSVAHRGGWQPLPSPCLVGLLDQPLRLHAPGRLDVLGIRCFPWTVFGLLGLPAGQDGGRVAAHPIAGLQAGLAALVQAGRVAEALGQLARYAEETWGPATGDQLLGKAGAAMRQTHGTLPVSQVAAAAHATVRTLERRFKQSSGYTVKDVSGLMRFEQVRNRLWQQPEANLAGLAQELGYADQAHLSREFRRYSGTTPGAFARQARRSRPAPGTDFVAFVQA